MNLCIQHPAEGTTYLLPKDALEEFACEPGAREQAADVMFVIPSTDLVQELPASRLSDAVEPLIQVADPDRDRSWMIPFEKLSRFRVPVPPLEMDDITWFAIPEKPQLVGSVPVFRKAPVQHSC